MRTLFEKQVALTPSYCDASGRMSISAFFTLFQDAASEHAEWLGVGCAEMMAKKLFWLTLRTRVRIFSRPAMPEQLTLQSWTKRRDRMHCDRFYRLLTKDGSRLAEGRTEWGVMDWESGRLCEIERIGMTAEMEKTDEPLCMEAFRRFPDDLTQEEALAPVLVRPSDTDMGMHMNNVAYVRAITDSIPSREQAKLSSLELELAFRSSCLEGELLPLFRRQTENGFLFVIRRPNGKTALLAELRTPLCEK